MKYLSSIFLLLIGLTAQAQDGPMGVHGAPNTDILSAASAADTIALPGDIPAEWRNNILKIVEGKETRDESSESSTSFDDSLAVGKWVTISDNGVTFGTHREPTQSEWNTLRAELLALQKGVKPTTKLCHSRFIVYGQRGIAIATHNGLYDLFVPDHISWEEMQINHLRPPTRWGAILPSQEVVVKKKYRIVVQQRIISEQDNEAETRFTISAEAVEIAGCGNSFPGVVSHTYSLGTLRRPKLTMVTKTIIVTKVKYVVVGLSAAPIVPLIQAPCAPGQLCLNPLPWAGNIPNSKAGEMISERYSISLMVRFPRRQGTMTTTTTTLTQAIAQCPGTAPTLPGASGPGISPDPPSDPYQPGQGH